MTHAQYNQKFIQLRGKLSKPSQDKSTKNFTKPSPETENITVPIGNRSVLQPKKKLNTPLLTFETKKLSVSAPKQLMKQGEKSTNKVARIKDWDRMETEEATGNIKISLEEGELKFTTEESELEPVAEDNQENIEEVELSEDSKMSIERFRSFIRAISGGDGTGYTAIEGRLARDPGSEDDILQGFLDFWGQ